MSDTMQEVHDALVIAEGQRDQAKMRAEAAEVERDALRTDAERLDWLESRKSYSLSNLGGMKCSHIYVNSGGDVSVTISTTKPTIREAIDAALSVQP